MTPAKEKSKKESKLTSALYFSTDAQLSRHRSHGRLCTEYCHITGRGYLAWYHMCEEN